MHTTLRALFLAAVLFGSAAVTYAESREADAVTLGALTRSADAVVVVRAPEQPEAVRDGRALWRFSVESLVRGEVPAEEIEVETSAVPGTVRPRGEHLVFLSRDDAGGWTLRDEVYGVRDLGVPDAAELGAHVLRYSELVGPDGRAADEPALAEHLVRSLESVSPGVAYAAGRDVVHHEEVLPHFDASHRVRLAAALRRDRKPDRDVAGLVTAAGLVGGEEIASALVTRLRDGAWHVRRAELTDALGRVSSLPVLAALTRDVSRLDAPLRGDVAAAVGKLGLRDGHRSLVALLRDGDEAVRAEACHALGRLARSVRRPTEETEERRPLVEARPHLATVVRDSADDSTRRAALWALAQIDHAAAWDELRTFEESDDAWVRRWAKHYLAQPRVSLVLDR